MNTKIAKPFLASACLLICVALSGCYGPRGFGVGCGALGGGCNDCDGTYNASLPIPTSPLDQLRQWKRSLVCGGGCGEVYYGEWVSTPPDSCDPCQRDQFVGGAVKCTPFCSPIAPCGRPFCRLAGLYGKRFCDSCQGGGCNECSSAPIVDHGFTHVDQGFAHVDHGFAPEPIHSGCQTCDARAADSLRLASPSHTVQMTEQQFLAYQQMQETQNRLHQAQPVQSVQPVRAARQDLSGGRLYR